MKIENGNYLSINEVTDKYLKSSNNTSIKGMEASINLLMGKINRYEAEKIFYRVTDQIDQLILKKTG